MSPFDYAALAFFLTCWLCYQPMLRRLSVRSGLINTDMTVVRARWMANMARRDNRFLDSQLMGHALNSASFFASANLIVIAAAGGALFNSDDTYRAVSEFAPVAGAPRWVFEVKLALVVAALARGFLDFVWAIRQMNYCLAVIGAAPPADGDPERVRTYGEAAAEILNPALSTFNTGVRGYYFALAAASWLLGPAAMAIATAGAVALLIGRQTRSRAASGVHRLRLMLDEAGAAAPVPPEAEAPAAAPAPKEP